MSRCVPNSSHCLLCIPVDTHRLCRAPHCRTPTVPLPHLANTSTSFLEALLLELHRRSHEAGISAMESEFIYNARVERIVLERFMSGELVGLSVRAIQQLVASPVERAQLSRLVDSVMPRSAGRFRIDSSKIYEKSILLLMEYTQAIVDATRTPTAKRIQPQFCLHSLVKQEGAGQKLKWQFSAGKRQFRFSTQRVATRSMQRDSLADSITENWTSSTAP